MIESPVFIVVSVSLTPHNHNAQLAQNNNKITMSVHGIPAWQQVYCRGFVYADLKTDVQAIDLMVACIRNGSMDQAALGQFETHNQCAALLRAFGSTIARYDGKVN